MSFSSLKKPQMMFGGSVFLPMFSARPHAERRDEEKCLFFVFLLVRYQ